MKRKSIRQSILKDIIFIILAGVNLFCYPAGSIVFAQDLTQIESADGKKKTYYAGADEFLTTGLDLTDRYWSGIAKIGKRLLRGHLDNYLPITLKSLDHEPAEAMMRSFADYFFAASNPNTGLIPYSYDSRFMSQTMRTKNKQPVNLIAKGVQFCQWFPEDQNLQNSCVNLAKATIKYFDFKSEQKGGIWGWVDVETGSEPRILLTRTQDFGGLANGIAYLSQKMDNPQLMQWADQKLEFVWQNRMHEQLPVLNEQFIPTEDLLRPEEMSSDTDTLYYVRQLFDLYDLTGEQKYRDWALAVTNLWYEKAWNEQWGHFIRKLNPDGTPAVNTLYGDGKYNTLYILVHAYKVTQDAKYIDRLKRSWDNLLQMGKNGLAPQYIKQGKMVDERGLDKQQTIFLDILVAAYEASGDNEILEAAEDLGKRIIEEGEQVMRMEGGQAGKAFLRLALARQKIRRLEVTLGKTDMLLRLKQNEKRVLEVIVPGEVAVVYLPEGSYELKVGKDGFSRTKNIMLDQNKKEKMF